MARRPAVEGKTPDQLRLMRRAGRVVARTLDAVVAEVRPGVTTAELDAVAAACRSGQGPGDPYKNFLWNVKPKERKSNGQRDTSQIMSGLNRMRD